MHDPSCPLMILLKFNEKDLLESQIHLTFASHTGSFDTLLQLI